MKGYVDANITAINNSLAGANATMVTSVTGTAPVTSSGGATPAISMAAATASANGFMTSTYASKLDGIAAGATNVTNTNQLTNGAGFVTASVTLTTAAQTNITSVGTLTGLTTSDTITSKTPVVASSLSAANYGAIEIPNPSPANSGTNYIIGYHQYSTLSGYGYGQHLSIGQKRPAGGAWGSAVIAVGGNDSYPTVEWLFNYDGSSNFPGLINGTATSARYADLAEKYTSDKKYVPGTVVVFGGVNEVTVSDTSHDTKIAGVVSTNPAYLMNSELEGVEVALQGRVPCRVLGPVVKGDRVVTSDVRGVAERLDMTKYQPGCIIGKALGSVPDGEIATIEVVVGRN
jgi:hypothetical protein